MSFRRDTKEMKNWASSYFEGVGRYDIPQIQGTENVPPPEFVGFNYAKTTERAGKTCHFYLDDYQFNRVWDRPEQSLELLKGFDYVLSPDFSLYADYPKAVQIFNHYRKHWCAVYWQSEGLNVIPTISWSDPESYDWCFDGEPKRSVVSISTIGIMRSANARRLFALGFEAMMKRIKPTQVLCFGYSFDELSCLNDERVVKIYNNRR